MMIWLGLAIPCIVCTALLFWFRQKVVWWEYVLIFAISFVVIPLCVKGFEWQLASDIEYLGGWSVRTDYYEEWTEEYDCMCDEDGRNCSTCYTHHPAEWYAVVGLGMDWEESVPINEARYREIAQRFGTSRQYQDIIRFNQSSIGDGDRYYYLWNGDRANGVTMTVGHRYENRVLAAGPSALGFESVTEEEAAAEGLYDYPAIQSYYVQRAIIGPTGNTLNSLEAEEQLQVLNADYGSQHQVRVYVLLYEGSSRRVAFRQESYWFDGNKNEFIVAVGLNADGSVAWGQPISWTPNELFKIETQQFLEDSEGPLDLAALATHLRHEIPSMWERQEFSDFDYMAVRVPMWAAVLSWLIILIFNLFMAFFVVHNEWEEGGVVSRFRRRTSFRNFRRF